MKIFKEIIIHSPIQSVYSAYANILTWKSVLQDVVDIKVLYDDGFHQEFEMTVLRDDRKETVCSKRFCFPFRKIEIFQTSPPPLFKSMSGLWEFTAHELGTHVGATRNFEVKEGLFDTTLLENFLEKNLSSFKQWIENATNNFKTKNTVAL